jgi:hypothetical protein
MSWPLCRSNSGSLFSRDDFVQQAMSRSLENGKVAVLRTVVILCIWVAAMGLIGDLALHAHGLGSSALLAVAAASAVAILG